MLVRTPTEEHVVSPIVHTQVSVVVGSICRRTSVVVRGRVSTSVNSALNTYHITSSEIRPCHLNGKCRDLSSDTPHRRDPMHTASVTEVAYGGLSAAPNAYLPTKGDPTNVSRTLPEFPGKGHKPRASGTLPSVPTPPPITSTPGRKTDGYTQIARIVPMPDDYYSNIGLITSGDLMFVSRQASPRLSKNYRSQPLGHNSDKISHINSIRNVNEQLATQTYSENNTPIQIDFRAVWCTSLQLDANSEKVVMDPQLYAWDPPAAPPVGFAPGQRLGLGIPEHVREMVDEWRLDGVAMSTDHQAVHGGVMAGSSPLLFNVAVQGSARVNNGFHTCNGDFGSPIGSFLQQFDPLCQPRDTLYVCLCQVKRNPAERQKVDNRRNEGIENTRRVLAAVRSSYTSASLAVQTQHNVVNALGAMVTYNRALKNREELAKIAVEKARVALNNGAALQHNYEEAVRQATATNQQPPVAPAGVPFDVGQLRKDLNNALLKLHGPEDTMVNPTQWTGRQFAAPYDERDVHWRTALEAEGRTIEAQYENVRILEAAVVREGTPGSTLALTVKHLKSFNEKPDMVIAAIGGAVGVIPALQTAAALAARGADPGLAARLNVITAAVPVGTDTGYTAQANRECFALVLAVLFGLARAAANAARDVAVAAADAARAQVAAANPPAPVVGAPPPFAPPMPPTIPTLDFADEGDARRVAIAAWNVLVQHGAALTPAALQYAQITTDRLNDAIGMKRALAEQNSHAAQCVTEAETAYAAANLVATEGGLILQYRLITSRRMWDVVRSVYGRMPSIRRVVPQNRINQTYVDRNNDGRAAAAAFNAHLGADDDDRAALKDAGLGKKQVKRLKRSPEIVEDELTMRSMLGAWNVCSVTDSRAAAITGPGYAHTTLSTQVQACLNIKWICLRDIWDVYDGEMDTAGMGGVYRTRLIGSIFAHNNGIEPPVDPLQAAFGRQLPANLDPRAWALNNVAVEKGLKQRGRKSAINALARSVEQALQHAIPANPATDPGTLALAAAPLPPWNFKQHGVHEAMGILTGFGADVVRQGLVQVDALVQAMQPPPAHTADTMVQRFMGSTFGPSNIRGVLVVERNLVAGCHRLLADMQRMQQRVHTNEQIILLGLSSQRADAMRQIASRINVQTMKISAARKSYLVRCTDAVRALVTPTAAGARNQWVVFRDALDGVGFSGGKLGTLQKYYKTCVRELVALLYLDPVLKYAFKVAVREPMGNLSDFTSIRAQLPAGHGFNSMDEFISSFDEIGQEDDNAIAVLPPAAPLAAAIAAIAAAAAVPIAVPFAPVAPVAPVDAAIAAAAAAPRIAAPIAPIGAMPPPPPPQAVPVPVPMTVDDEFEQTFYQVERATIPPGTSSSTGASSGGSSGGSTNVSPARIRGRAVSSPNDRSSSPPSPGAPNVPSGSRRADRRGRVVRPSDRR